jgi:hypothetical protein
MTHTNHRLGSSKSLEEDYIIFTTIEQTLTPEQRNKVKPGTKIVIEACGRHNPVLLSTDLKDARDRKDDGSASPIGVLLPDGLRSRARWMKYWNGERSHTDMVKKMEDILAIENPQRQCYAVFDNKESFQRALSDIKKANPGVSVIVSGNFNDVFEACARAGLEPHTVNMSAGIWGRTDLLPDRRILEITTMCGHGYVSRHLVEHLINRIRRGKFSLEDAAVEMAKQCVCNVFNPVRAVHLMKEYLDDRE